MMDLNSLWGRTQSAWSDYRNPTMSDDQLWGLMPQYTTSEFAAPSFGNAANGFTNDISGGLGGADVAFGGGLGDASGMRALWTKFQDSPFKDQVSAVGSTIGAAANAYNAYNSVKLGKQQFALQKDAWNKQYAAQKNTTNAALADRQAARVASNPGAYQSVDSYMKKYGIQ